MAAEANNSGAPRIPPPVELSALPGAEHSGRDGIPGALGVLATASPNVMAGSGFSELPRKTSFRRRLGRAATETHRLLEVFRECDLLTPEVQKGLDVSIKCLPDVNGDSHRCKVLLDTLHRKGVCNVRQLLLGGGAYLAQNPRVLPKSSNLLRSAVGRVCPEVPFLDWWAPEDIARFCPRLDQVPTYALRYCRGLKSFDRDTGHGRRASIGDFASGRLAYTKDERDNGIPGLVDEFIRRFIIAQDNMNFWGGS